MLETERLAIVEATESDIGWIIAQENDEKNRKFIWVGTYEEHLAEIADPGHRLLVIRRKDGVERVGYVLACLDFKSERFELWRIVIAQKGRGLRVRIRGRASLSIVSEEPKSTGCDGFIGALARHGVG